MAIATWTIDAGYGMDDHIAFITSNGEVIIYKGTDPAVAASWSLIGVYEFGSPIGRRCVAKFAGDLVVITQDGLTPMSRGLQSSRLDPRVNITDKIQSAMADAASSYGTSFGWEIVTYAPQNLLILNVPVAVGSQQQFVMNTINGSWSNFTGWAANTFVVDGSGYLYYGGNGVVCRALNGLVDGTSNISTDALQAFSYYGQPGILKRWTMMRPVFRTNGSPATLGTVNVDYDTSTTSSPLAFAVTASGTWDLSVWDTGIWGAGLNAVATWQGVNAIGYAGAPHLITSSQSIELQWVSTDLVMERGAVI